MTVTGVGDWKPAKLMREPDTSTVVMSSVGTFCAKAPVIPALAISAVAEPPSKSCFTNEFMIPPKGYVSSTRRQNFSPLAPQLAICVSYQTAQVNECAAQQF